MKIDYKQIHLKGFLEYKTLYYDKIDFSTVQNSWSILQNHISIPYVIHLVGTNGKGTTGRYLAHYLNAIGKEVVHYSSPHITSFNERIWINGSDVSNEVLEKAHEQIQMILSLELLERLTYFEYTTLLALFLSSKKDYIVLEAGLGGEFDATNIVKNDLSLITTIDLDHQSFLGDTIEEIALTKMRSCDTSMIVGHQVNDEVYDHAKTIEVQRELKCLTLDDFIVPMVELPIPEYLKNNLKLTMSALQYLDFEIDISLFESVKFQGRCQKIANNITIDVGHNPLAAHAIAKEFDGQKVHLIYNSFEDKEYEKVLKILKPIIKSMTILPLEDKRVVEKEKLIKVCENLNIMLNQNVELTKDEEYLAFGSFLVVENLIELYKDNEFNEK